RDAASWCHVLILPFNTKHCSAGGQGGESHLTMRIGRKASQAPENAYPIEFRYRVESRDPDFLRVSLKAENGPLGTRNYEIAIERYLASPAVPERGGVGKRINDWFAATEKYPRQLHEMDRGEYVAMKKKEATRVNAAL